MGATQEACSRRLEAPPSTPAVTEALSRGTDCDLVAERFGVAAVARIGA